jgi:thioredoxin reductase (NADPH)
METLITVAALALVTAVSIALHLRSGRRGGRPSTDTRPCPRCSARVPSGAERCGSCGAPLQAYELVTARVVDETDAANASGTPHAIVRTDTCVGCGACVAVCPEPGAIRLEGKMAIVHLDRCKGHGECAKACPVGGIFLASGGAGQRVEVPWLNTNFETNVPGLFVVGELGGRGLIKNAINEGKLAVERIARAVPKRPPAGPRATGTESGAVGDLYDVIIVGSGPAGLSAGLEALRSGLRYLILERGDLSDTIRRYPRHKILMAEPVRVPMYGDLWVSDASKESLLQVWQNIVARTGLEVTTGRTVDRVARTGGQFEVGAGAEVYRGSHVVLALGRRGTPRKLGVPGEERPNVFYDVVEMEAFAKARVLVVGGGDSAIETVIGLARQEGTQVTLSYRGEEFTKIKDRNREHLKAAMADGRVACLLRSQVREIGADSVRLDVEGEPKTVPADYVIIRVGGDPPFEFLKRAGVRIVTKEIAVPGAHEAAVA